MVFDELHDPQPPEPGIREFAIVAERAQAIRRRRAAWVVRVASVFLVVGAVGSLYLLANRTETTPSGPPVATPAPRSEATGPPATQPAPASTVGLSGCPVGERAATDRARTGTADDQRRTAGRDLRGNRRSHVCTDLRRRLDGELCTSRCRVRRDRLRGGCGAPCCPGGGSDHRRRLRRLVRHVLSYLSRLRRGPGRRVLRSRPRHRDRRSPRTRPAGHPPLTTTDHPSTHHPSHPRLRREVGGPALRLRAANVLSEGAVDRCIRHPQVGDRARHGPGLRALRARISRGGGRRGSWCPTAWSRC